ncbi:hypothetical protein TEQG_07169 [Trichophyton equinum CBS 127.97]|uniref:Uncharacterized protein n=1 Tax=Trichophyton equinum (strain ATCC MYA-4606 / CBS 127.97) TaxID=559882 RepID=F2Q274_TRIEC|nr:hypothetical protein TEQG_07169 [Trichophyton equinum CBS 127.97]
MAEAVPTDYPLPDLEDECKELGNWLYRYPYDTIALGGKKISNATISYGESSAKVRVKIGTPIRVTRHAYFTPDWYCLVIPKSGLKE